MNIQQYWKDICNQDADAIRQWFFPDAWINWHNTNEHFTVEGFIRANCEYPGDWVGEIEQIFFSNDYIITACHVYTRDEINHFHVTSFIRTQNNKIISIDEYWGEDGLAPQWRTDLKIGNPLK